MFFSYLLIHNHTNFKNTDWPDWEMTIELTWFSTELIIRPPLICTLNKKFLPFVCLFFSLKLIIICWFFLLVSYTLLLWLDWVWLGSFFCFPFVVLSHTDSFSLSLFLSLSFSSSWSMCLLRWSDPNVICALLTLFCYCESIGIFFIEWNNTEMNKTIHPAWSWDRLSSIGPYPS